jgi:thiamine pyrophosphokinase
MEGASETAESRGVELWGEPVPGLTLALVLANYTLPDCLPGLWRRAALRLVADGGANHLYDQLPDMLDAGIEEAR